MFPPPMPIFACHLAQPSSCAKLLQLLGVFGGTTEGADTTLLS